MYILCTVGNICGVIVQKRKHISVSECSVIFQPTGMGVEKTYIYTRIKLCPVEMSWTGLKEKKRSFQNVESETQECAVSSQYILDGFENLNLNAPVSDRFVTCCLRHYVF